MRGTEGSRLPWPLRHTAERFDRWRRTRELGTRIPESLWTRAAKLAATYGVCRTASTLKLDYYNLKRRLEEGQSRLAERTSPAVLARGSTRQPAFLELPASTLAPPGECVIDFENSAGARMRVHLKGVAVPDLAVLARSLWSAE
jgi:hypothetical protein